jgi:hypothetical protein
MFVHEENPDLEATCLVEIREMNVRHRFPGFDLQLTCMSR